MRGISIEASPLHRLLVMCKGPASFVHGQKVVRSRGSSDKLILTHSPGIFSCLGIISRSVSLTFKMPFSFTPDRGFFVREVTVCRF